jgi:tRNA(Ile)-lysidine synthase
MIERNKASGVRFSQASGLNHLLVTILTHDDSPRFLLYPYNKGLTHDHQMPPVIHQPECDQTALVAVSGGRDSVALLHWLYQQGCRKLIVCHFNHRLRGRESGQDAAFVRRLAARYALSFELKAQDVAAHAAQQGISVETAGRKLRYRYLAEVAVKHDCQRIYVAHHLDDQAETILANLCRGTGLTGMSGMTMESPLPATTFHDLCLTRPLLNWRRTDIDAYVKEHKLQFREDSTNRQGEARRNRLRHEALPLLCQIFDRDISPMIVRFGQLAERDDEALNQMAQTLLQQHLTLEGHLKITKPLRGAHPALLSRILKSWLVEICQIPDLGFMHLEKARLMLNPMGVAKINLPGNFFLRRKAGKLWIEANA